MIAHSEHYYACAYEALPAAPATPAERAAAGARRAAAPPQPAPALGASLWRGAPASAPSNGCAAELALRLCTFFGIVHRLHKASFVVHCPPVLSASTRCCGVCEGLTNHEGTQKKKKKKKAAYICVRNMV